MALEPRQHAVLMCARETACELLWLAGGIQATETAGGDFVNHAQVKLWDVADNKPSLVAAQDLKVGACFTAAFCQEVPWLLAAGGAAGTVAVWDILTNAAVSSKYGKQVRRQTA